MTKLPCPLHTSWEKIAKRPKRGSLYLAKISFEHPRGNRYNGLPFRTVDHHLQWPRCGTGVYWSCEIEAAERLLGAKITFHHGWIARITPCKCNLYQGVAALYDRRKELDREAAGKGMPLKLAINALYGKLVQRRGAAPYRDFIAGGLITALTRTQLIEAIAPGSRDIVMIATDALYSTRPLTHLQVGADLGQWEVKEHSSIFIAQPGLYWFPTTTRRKTRGIQKAIFDSHYPLFEAAWDKFLAEDYFRYVYPGIGIALVPADHFPTVKIKTDLFVGISQAVHKERNSLYLRDLGKWYAKEIEIDFDWTRKRAGAELGPDGEHVMLHPIEGNISDQSRAYDHRGLTDILRQREEFEAFPDFINIIKPDHDEQ